MKNFSIFLLLSLLMNGCIPQCHQKISINEIKSLPLTSIPGDKKYEVTGYYNSDPVPMLISTTTWLHLNTPMPDSAFVVLSSASPGLEKLIADPNQYYGALVRVTGTIRRDTIRLQGDSTTRIETQLEANAVSVVKVAPAGSNAPSAINICTLNPTICGNSTTPADPHKFALLYSGGCDDNNAKIRYWNDLVFMYRTLLYTYGYPASNITVVYKGGTAENNNMPVNYRASANGLDQAIAHLRSKLTSQDQLLVFTSNHGGGKNPNNTVENGLIDEAGFLTEDEQETSNRIDETIFYYYPDVTLRDEEFAAKLNSLTVGRMITLHQPCYSGGLLWDLNHPNRINMSAAGEMEKSWSNMPADNYDAFAYYFIAAMYGKTHDGQLLPGASPSINPANNPGNLNPDPDPRISILEAFLYANSKDNSSQHLLDDSGNGIGNHLPSASDPDGDGFLSNTTFF